MNEARHVPRRRGLGRVEPCQARSPSKARLAAASVLLLAVACGFLAGAGAAAPNRPPNIVFILADDLGYGDIGCFGAPDAKTPHIDELAARGIKFTNFYANGQECTPTRTALLTGRYQQRTGGLECAIGTGNVGRYDEAIALAKANDLGLPPPLAVLPQALKPRGYHCSIIGKWHLGYEDKFNPLEFGFDSFYGVLGGNCDYFTHRELSPLPVFFEDRRPVEAEGYFTHLLTDRALRYLDGRASSDRPFFLYLPYTTPHFPFQTPGDQSKVVTAENFTEGTREDYVVMLEDLDTQVGKILRRLRDLGIADHTVVAFASDHGAMRPGRNLPYRDFKGTVFEGGIRAPLALFVPEDGLMGKTATFPAMMFDLTSTFLHLAGVRNTGELRLDGIDLLQPVRSGTPPPARDLFWRGRRGDRTWLAVRDGKTKLKYLRKTEGGNTSEWLFDLGTDPLEQNNLIGEQPFAGPAQELRVRIADWEKEVSAER